MLRNSDLNTKHPRPAEQARKGPVALLTFPSSRSDELDSILLSILLSIVPVCCFRPECRCALGWSKKHVNDRVTCPAPETFPSRYTFFLNQPQKPKCLPLLLHPPSSRADLTAVCASVRTAGMAERGVPQALDVEHFAQVRLET